MDTSLKWYEERCKKGTICFSEYLIEQEWYWEHEWARQQREMERMNEYFEREPDNYIS